MDSNTKAIIKSDIIIMIKIYLNAACKRNTYNYLLNNVSHAGICYFMHNSQLRITSLTETFVASKLSKIPNYPETWFKWPAPLSIIRTKNSRSIIINRCINPRIEFLHNLLKELD